MRLTKLWRYLAMSAFIILLAELPAGLGQTVSGRIAGVVTDPSGNAVPGAQVTLTNEGTGAQRTTASERAGTYIIESVLPASYSLQVKKEGFKAYVVSDIVLRVNESRTVNVQLS